MSVEKRNIELELRCMSYNIKNAYDMEGENGWLSRKELVAGVIRFHRPDLVGLQEVLYNQLEDLQQLLPEYGWIGVGREDGKRDGEFSCIFYRKKRLRPLRQNTFWLSEQPEEPGSLGWDAACRRVVTWAEFEDTYSGQTFLHFNTHFDHVGQVAVEQSAHLILKRIGDLAAGIPAVLTGDFNVTSDSVSYRVLTQKNESGSALLRDAGMVADYNHFGPAFTFQDFDSREVAARMFPDLLAPQDKHGIEFESPIDFIFVTDQVHVLSYGSIVDHYLGKMPSDHFPVVADLRIS
ncbi:endonuclease/exonuclease/phosphatase family protein [Paenibacillus sp. KQZ6P-2]|uniref:Endonuclease/exonuclease/phosphatase family protein n=1 Tax=Paenibacillus mangrovi TaxID=2931978 RepID=A0A9X1WUD7_9BACL|nr:endonuclease/exonuclease/phosphatase family protein [Paenibacillus mangrovi]MCJ8013850.1 endonuclease/exonuclease/phosphatase family protein [Paenibacillus mangrovi]